MTPKEALLGKREAVHAKLEELRLKADWSADDKTASDTLWAEFDHIQSQIETHARLERVEEARQAEESERHRLEQGKGSPLPVGDPTPEDETKRYHTAFDAFLRHGEARMSTEHRDLLGRRMEQHVMSTGIGSEGGYLVPETMMTDIISALKAYGGVRALARTITTSRGETMTWPTEDTTTVLGEWLAENAAAGDADLAFGAVDLKAWIASSKTIATPISLIEDSATNLEAHIGEKIGERIGRLQAAAWVHGTGIGQPRGLVGGRDTAKDVNTTAALTFADFNSLVRKVDIAYRNQGGAWIFNDTTAAAVRLLADPEGHYIWSFDARAGDSGLLLGYPVTIDNAMDSDAATGGGSSTTGVPVLFGLFSQAYLIRDVRGVAILRDPYGTYGKKRQVAFTGFMRTDGNVIDQNAYAAIERAS